MKNTLNEGDFIFVNKWAYGPRIPITPLSLPFNEDLYLDFHLPYKRIPGYSSPERNDVIVFNLPSEILRPVDKRKDYVKRCIALAGDTLLIKNGIVFINGKPIIESEEILFQYQKISIQGEKTGGYLTSEEADSIYKKGFNVNRFTYPKDHYHPAIFPHSSFIRWNPDHFGPYYIPGKGVTIQLNSGNIVLYKDIIQEHEHNTVSQLGSKILINGKEAESYTFTMDYYFALGDNRYNSIDSRYFGCIPENHLIGQVPFVIYSPEK